jgi:hypothetical protein
MALNIHWNKKNENYYKHFFLIEMYFFNTTLLNFEHS